MWSIHGAVEMANTAICFLCREAQASTYPQGRAMYIRQLGVFQKLISEIVGDELSSGGDTEACDKCLQTIRQVWALQQGVETMQKQIRALQQGVETMEKQIREILQEVAKNKIKTKIAEYVQDNGNTNIVLFLSLFIKKELMEYFNFQQIFKKLSSKGKNLCQRLLMKNQSWL